MDPMDRVRAYEQAAADAGAALEASSQGWREDQVAQLEADGWTDAAARAKAQLTETETEITEEVSYADRTKEELYAEVQNRGITGMSQANKDELISTLEADDRGEIQAEEG